MNDTAPARLTARRRKSNSKRRDAFYLGVEGFKAVRDPVTMKIAPLTLIAGANSSGKSSFMQPFLVLKQTLEAPFDPGAILLYGPNAKFTDQSQLLSRGTSKNSTASSFKVTFQRGESVRTLQFSPGPDGFMVDKDTRRSESVNLTVSLKPTQSELRKLREHFTDEVENLTKSFPKSFADSTRWEIEVNRNRFFLDPVASLVRNDRLSSSIQVDLDTDPESARSEEWIELLQGLIHVPGLRGNPERSYPRSAVGETYPGTFETYVASLIHSWVTPSEKSEADASERLAALSFDLNELGLTWKVTTRRLNDASLELLVGRLPHARQGGAWDLVSVADVGFGVSQTLPVLAALHAAERGQIVYIEQPEIHLHPRAQLAMANCLVRAARRGVFVVAETHSSLVVRGIQTLVAQEVIPAADVSLNWFDRDQDNGVTRLATAQIDSNGRFGDWPVDFDEISQDADWAYLDAVGNFG